MSALFWENRSRLRVLGDVQMADPAQPVIPNLRII